MHTRTRTQASVRLRVEDGAIGGALLGRAQVGAWGRVCVWSGVAWRGVARRGVGWGGARRGPLLLLVFLNTLVDPFPLCFPTTLPLQWLPWAD